MKRPLVLSEILQWADAHREASGRWPTRSDGFVLAKITEKWSSIDKALRHGRRGLPKGSSLARLLSEHRDVDRHSEQLATEQILAWADAHHKRTGTWPKRTSGTIPNSGGETWSGVSAALFLGRRGLPGGSSLARFLAAARSVRNHRALPSLTLKQILAWADLHHAQHGTWPSLNSGPIHWAAGETWQAVDEALRSGLRGLRAGWSLALLLARHRGARNVWSRPDLSIAQILAWADNYHERTGNWPRQGSGPIPTAQGETWAIINNALKRGTRGLPGGSSLARLLYEEREAGNRIDVPDLNPRQILAWMKAHHKRTGSWPTRDSGPIVEAPEETWPAVEAALVRGSRGLAGGSSLAQFLADHGKKRNIQNLPPLSLKKILAWADAHHEQTGKWPNVNSGPVTEAPGERWDWIEAALGRGGRGLKRGQSLRRLLIRKRGLRDARCLPPLTEAQILRWAELHFVRTGKWPSYKSGPIAEAVGETWGMVDFNLRYGKRGLPPGSSLAKLLANANLR